MADGSGTLICFTGMDGSGKTTQATLLVASLSSQGIDARYVWSRGEERWRRPLLALGRLVLGVPSSPHGQAPADRSGYQRYQSRKSRLFRSRFMRWLWGEFVRLEHVAQIRAQVLPPLRAGAVVVTDRYVWDSLIDLAVAFNASENWLIDSQRHRASRFVPSPDLNLFLDVPAETALSRKADIPSPDYIYRRIGLYRCLAAHHSMICLNGCLDAAAIHDEVVRRSLAIVSARGAALHA